MVGGIVLLILQFADDQFKAAFTGRPFIKYQFQIALSNLAAALQAAGLYEDEPEAIAAIYESMTGKGYITFTWLEPELFYVHTTDQFKTGLEFSIDLPPFGTRKPERYELSDMLEMRMTGEGYELVLLTREQRYCWPETTRGKGVVLFRLPYTFFGSLRGDPYAVETSKKTAAILSGAGLTYWSDAEVSNAWDYKNEYGTFRWWDV